MKRFFSLLLLITIFTSLLTPASASTADKESTIFRGISGSEMQDLIELYPDEIALIERECNISIEKIDEDNLEDIKSVAVNYLYDSRYNFTGFMTELSVLHMEKEVWSYIPAMHAQSNGDVYTDNVEVTVFRNYGPLKGKYITQVPVGAEKTETSTISVGISSGDIIDGIEISIGASASTSYTVSGPPDDTFMCDGRLATDRIAVAVFYSAINKIEYDIVNEAAGVTTHYVMYVVDFTLAKTKDHTALAVFATPCYVESVYGNYVVKYANDAAFIAAFEKTPSIILFTT